MKTEQIKNQSGYSLIELIVVMIIISVLTTVSMRYMGNSVNIAKTAETKEELDQISHSIVGNDQLVSGNHRTDYGYVGDIGALPSSLNDLVTNPGLATWDGPYIKDDFYALSGSTETEYLIDGWGKSYGYASSLNISSTGGTTTITKALANSTNDILNNSVSFNIIDIDYCPPGLVNKDSIKFNLTYPNGIGSYQTDSKFPSSGGYVSFDSIPIGQQTLSVIEMKNNDTLTRKIHINPNSSTHANIQVPTSLWCDTSSGAGGSTGALVYVSGSAQTTGQNCDKFNFNLQNTSIANITITTITTSWTTPVSFFNHIKIGVPKVYHSHNPRTPSGQIANITSTTINAGSTVTLTLDGFVNSITGGTKTNISNTDMTMTFSDGSVITFNTGVCP